MPKIKKETLKKLDEINCVKALEQVSLGNLVRGIDYLLSAFDEAKNCLKAASDQIKENMPACDEEVPVQKKTVKKKKAVSKKSVKK